jgi:tetratricopeptide (TPR) repeat protein
LEAAAQAERSLAFERAAALYKHALDLEPTAADEWTLARKLGEARANAGRDSEAGEAFERAVNALSAHGNPDPEVLLELRSRAAEQYLQGAQVDKGLQVIRAVLQEHGIAYPKSSARSVAGVIETRVRLLVRGLAFRRSAQVGRATEARLEGLWIAAKSLAFVNAMSTTLFSARLTLEAFSAGHAGYLARGLAMVASQDTMLEVPFLYRRADRVLALVKRLADESGSQYEQGFYHLSCSGTSWFRGRFAASLQHSELAAELFAGIGRRASYELAICSLWGIHSLAMTGELSRLATKLAAVRKDAQERSDLFSERTTALGQGVLARLAADDAERALERAEAIMQPGPPEFTIHCYHLLVTRAQTAWYQGRPERAWKHIVQDWSGVRAAMLDQIACVRDELLQLRAHGALAMAAVLGPRDTVEGFRGRRFDRSALLQLARSDAARLRRHRLTQCRPFAELVLASAAQLEGDTERATTLLQSASKGFDAAGMMLYREACNYHLHGRSSAPEHQRSLEWFAQHQVVAPERLVASLAPALKRHAAPSPSAIAQRKSASTGLS